MPEKTIGELISEGFTRGFASVQPFLDRREQLDLMVEDRDFQRGIQLEQQRFARAAEGRAEEAFEENILASRQGRQIAAQQNTRETELADLRKQALGQEIRQRSAAQEEHEEYKAFKANAVAKWRKVFGDDEEISFMLDGIESDPTAKVRDALPLVMQRARVKGAKEIVAGIKSGAIKGFDKSKVGLLESAIILGETPSVEFMEGLLDTTNEETRKFLKGMIPEIISQIAAQDGGVADPQKVAATLSLYADFADNIDEAYGNQKEPPQPIALDLDSPAAKAASAARNGVGGFFDDESPQLEQDVGGFMLNHINTAQDPEAREQLVQNAELASALPAEMQQAAYLYFSEPGRQFNGIESVGLLLNSGLGDSIEDRANKMLQDGKFKSMEDAKQAVKLANLASNPHKNLDEGAVSNFIARMTHSSFDGDMPENAVDQMTEFLENGRITPKWLSTMVGWLLPYDTEKGVNINRELSQMPDRWKELVSMLGSAGRSLLKASFGPPTEADKKRELENSPIGPPEPSSFDKAAQSLGLTRKHFGL